MAEQVHISEISTLQSLGSNEPLRCLVDQLQDFGDDEDTVIQFESADVNPGGNYGSRQILIECPIEGCSAEFEVFTNDNGAVTELSKEGLRTAAFICKQAKE